MMARQVMQIVKKMQEMQECRNAKIGEVWVI